LLVLHNLGNLAMYFDSMLEAALETGDVLSLLRLCNPLRRR
jgi:hypothetical protein